MFFAPRHRSSAPRRQVLAALGETGRATALRLISILPGHAATPLHSLPALAARAGIASIDVKDEGKRFGLNSFKALGGAYAVASLVLMEASRRLGSECGPQDLFSDETRAVAQTLTFAAATDGNHGRSVAWGAGLVGAGCEIFIHSGVSQARADAMAAFGARINRVDGSYDDSVALAAEMAAKHGWTVVSDTAWEGYESIPLTVMQGYTMMIGEALDEIAEPPTHIFLQAGVGGMAAAVAGYAAQRLGSAAPKIVVVEPERAACLFASAQAGRLVTIPHGEATVMAMLECATPSSLGWEVLSHLADGYLVLKEEQAVEAMKLLANPEAADPAIVAGESGGTGLAGFLAAMDDGIACNHLGLDDKSRILVFNSEGATDPAIYKRIVGRAPAEIAA